MVKWELEAVLATKFSLKNVGPKCSRQEKIYVSRLVIQSLTHSTPSKLNSYLLTPSSAEFSSLKSLLNHGGAYWVAFSFSHGWTFLLLYILTLVASATISSAFGHLEIWSRARIHVHAASWRAANCVSWCNSKIMRSICPFTHALRHPRRGRVTRPLILAARVIARANLNTYVTVLFCLFWNRKLSIDKFILLRGHLFCSFWSYNLYLLHK